MNENTGFGHNYLLKRSRDCLGGESLELPQPLWPMQSEIPDRCQVEAEVGSDYSSGSRDRFRFKLKPGRFRFKLKPGSLPTRLEAGVVRQGTHRMCFVCRRAMCIFSDVIRLHTKNPAAHLKANSVRPELCMRFFSRAFFVCACIQSSNQSHPLKAVHLTECTFTSKLFSK